MKALPLLERTPIGQQILLTRSINLLLWDGPCTPSDRVKPLSNWAKIKGWLHQQDKHIAEFEERENLSFSKEKPNLPSKDSFQPEIEGGLCWQRAAEGSKRI